MFENSTQNKNSKTRNNGQPLVITLCFFLIVMALIVGGIGCKPAPQYKGKAKILVWPGPFSYTMMEARFVFLIDYLTQETGWKLDMVAAPRDVEAALRLVKTEKFAFAIVNPYYYLVLGEKEGAVPILKMIYSDGHDSYRGLIVCQEGSPIQSLNDLRGKQILASSRSSIGGFIGQWILLKQQGLDPDRDLTYQFGEPQEGIIEKIISRRAEVGFIREDVYEGFKKAKGHTPEVKVLGYSQYFPNPCVVTFPDTNPELVEKLKAALLKLKLDNPTHRAMLERIRMSGFSPASVEDYKNFQDLLISYGLLSSGTIPSSQTVPSQ